MGKLVGTVAFGAVGTIIGGTIGFLGAIAGYVAGGGVADTVVDEVEDKSVDDSDALRLVRCICNNWLADFANLIPCPVADVVNQL
jgi:hypothetical protein